MPTVDQKCWTPDNYYKINEPPSLKKSLSTHFLKFNILAKI